MSWSEVEARRQGVAPEAETPEMIRLCWLVFGSGNGAALLKKLHEEIVDRRVNPAAPESALRVFETERQLVLRLEAWTAKGKGQDAKRAEKRSKDG